MASFLIGAINNQSSARLVPLQNPKLMGYAAYFQDDFELSGRMTLNLGLRWEYEPGPTDPDDRLSQRLDLTQAIPEMQATPPTMPSQALQLMASKGYSHIYNGAWVFATPNDRNAWHSTPWNFLPRVGLNYRIGEDAVARVAYARYMMPISNVRDTLGDFVNQYTGFAQTTTTLGLAAGIPQQTLRDPFPANNPVIEPYGQAYGRYTGLGGAVSLDEYELRPQINDRFNLSFQKEIWGNTIVDFSYFYNWGSRVPYDVNLNMMDPAFRYEQRAALNTQVNNPFFGYLTVEKFPGALRNNRTVTLGSLLVPYPQYGAITQTNTNGKLLRTQTFEIRAQKPFSSGVSFLAAYAWNRERIQQWFDDIAQYQVLTTNGEGGWEWRPTDSPVHRFTMAFSWELPVGRDRAYLSDMSVPLDLVLGGWQYTAAGRWYSGRPLLFGNSYVVTGDPRVEDQTHARWFDTSVFQTADTFAPRTNAWYFDGLDGPSAFFIDMTLTKNFNLTQKYRLEARIEAYNALNHIVWDNPGVVLGQGTFGTVTRKRTDAAGREIQFGLRFVF